MSKSVRQTYSCRFFTWKLFDRRGVIYADGRGNRHSLGKYSLGTRDRHEAEQNLKRLDYQMAAERGLVESIVARRDTTDLLEVATGWSMYERHCTRAKVLGGVSPSTWKRYRAVRDHHLAFCGIARVRYWQRVDKTHAEQFVQYLADLGQAEASLYLAATLMKQVVKWLIDDKQRLPKTQKFALKVKRPQVSSTHCFTPEQVASVLKLANERRDLAWLAPLLALLAGTGMRIGEAADLRWSDIDFAVGMIHIRDERHLPPVASASNKTRTTKSGKSRRVPLHPDLEAVLKKLARHPDGFLFHGPRGGRFKPDVGRRTLISEIIRPLQDKFPEAGGDGGAGFASARFHSFRHFFVSRGFLDGVSEGEIREWVGHASSRMIERYRHLSEKEARQRISRVDLFGGDTHGPDVS